MLNDLQNDKDKDGKKVTSIIKDVFENYTDTTIEFVITFSKGKLEELETGKGEYGCNGVEKLLKLYSTSSTTNMNLFNSEDKLKKYENVEEIIDDYYEIRFEYYEDRKEYIINTLEKDIIILSNKVKYIKEILDETIDLRKKKKQEIIDMLVEKKYYMIEDDKEFKYLVKMPMDSVSEENVEKMLNEHKEKADELERIKSTTIEEMWLSELEILENEYKEYQKERKQSQIGEVKVSNKKSITKVVKKIKKFLKDVVVVVEEEEEEEIIIQPKKKSILKKI